MKKAIIFALLAVLALGMLSCAQTKYKLEVIGEYRPVNELQESYSAGEKVTIKLDTIMDHYYLVYVNGVQHRPDELSSDDRTYTYYTFTMPSKDVTVTIEGRSPDYDLDPPTAVFNTNNIKSITFYAYYGGGNGSKVPDENMEEIIQWLQSFALGEKVEDEMLPPGTNTYHVEIEYEDGTVVKEGLDAVNVDGDLYYVKRDQPPACFYEIISKTSID